MLLIRNGKSLAPYRECRGGNAPKTERGSGRGTFDRGDLKEVAGSTRYGATTDALCNERLEGRLIAFHEVNSALQ